MQNYDYIHQLKHHIASTDHEGDLSEETFQNIISAIENNIQPPPLNNGVIEFCSKWQWNYDKIGFCFLYIEQYEAESECKYACMQLNLCI